MKTKFIKVPVSEIPNEDKAYFCLIANGQGLITCHNKMFHQYAGITHYLVEVEDREDEMRNLLTEIELDLSSNEDMNDFKSYYSDKINKLLNELKETT